MKKIIIFAMAAIAVLASCEKKAERNQVVDNLFTEKVETGYKLVSSYQAGVFHPMSDQVFDKVEYKQDLGLVFAYHNKTFSLFTKDGYERGEGEYTSYRCDGGIVYFPKGNQTTLYTIDNGIFLGTYENKDVVVDHNKIFVKAPKGWILRNIDGDYLTEFAYEKLYIVDMKSDNMYEKLGFRKGRWELTSSDGGVYDAASAKEAAKALARKRITAPVGVVDL